MIKKGIYKHYKGNYYKVLYIAKHTETLQDLIVYKALYSDDRIWVRPKKMFIENVIFNKEKHKRFKFIKQNDFKKVFCKKRNQLIEKLQRYAVRFSREQKTVEEFITFIKQNENCFERTNLVGHITGSAWVIDGNGKVLLMHHKKLNRWFQPGGHSDGDFNTLRVAQKEVQEETGLKNIVAVSTEIYDIDRHIIPSHGHEPEHYHYDIRFLIKAIYPEEIQKNDESNHVKWFDDKKFNDLDLDESITRMFNKMHLFV